MTAQKKLEVLQNTLWDVIQSQDGCNPAYERNQVESLKAAIFALKKQIPKKPLHMHKNFYCPVCKEDGWLLWDDAEPNDFDSYCCKCGQALDWGDTDEMSNSKSKE